MTNRVVVLAFTFIGFIVLVCLVVANCLEKKSYFMPGNGISSWKLFLLGVTVMASSLIGIVLQVLTYRHVKQLYRAHPNLRRKDRHLFQVKYQHANTRTQPEFKKDVLEVDSKCVVTTTSQQYSTSEKTRASRMDLEAGFYYFVISLPLLICNGTIGLFLTFNYICSYTELANVCHGWMAILLYIRTIQLLITACNPLIYYALSSEFRSACRSRFCITARQNKT